MLRHLRARTPLIFGLLLLFVGIWGSEYFGLYSHVAHIDKLYHVLGGLAVGWMATAVLQDDIKTIAGWKQLLIITSVACFVGILWEFAEYFANGLRYSHPLIYHYYHGGNFADTLGDIVADITGGAVFAVWALWRENKLMHPVKGA